MRRQTTIALLFAVLTIPSAHAQTAAFDAIIDAAMAEGETPGLAVAVVHDGEVIYQKNAGWAHIKDKVLVSGATPFMIGSVTKQFTAMAVMMLVEEGKVDLDASVRTYLPDVPEAYDAVTIRHMLAHASGIPRDFKQRSKKPFFNESLINEDLYAALAEAELEFQPGDGMKYSNTGYSLLYMVIEAVTGAAYSDVLKERIFEPLGMMSSTSRDHEQRDIEGLAEGYFKARKKFRPANPVLRLGGGSLVSTVDDLVKWDAALRSGTLVSQETLERIWTPYVLSNGETANMGQDPQGRQYQAGFGWFIGHAEGRGLVHHSGGIDGYAANIDRYREAGLTVIVLCNIENTTALTVSASLAEAFFATR